MIELVNAIIIISLIIIIYKYFEKNSYDVVMVKSEANGKQYLVRNLPDKQDASNLLGSIAIKLEKLVEIIKASGYETIYTKYIKMDLDKETSTVNVNGNKKILLYTDYINIEPNETSLIVEKRNAINNLDNRIKRAGCLWCPRISKNIHIANTKYANIPDIKDVKLKTKKCYEIQTPSQKGILLLKIQSWNHSSS